MGWIFQTEPYWAALFVRMGLAAVFFAHGSQQFLGWFGGRGFQQTLNNWKEAYKIPRPWGVVGILSEFFGSVAVFVGFLTRPAALLLAIFMVVAMERAHWKHGFFLGRAGAGNGIEFCLVLFLMALALLIGGAGSFSIDRLLSQ